MAPYSLARLTTIKLALLESGDKDEVAKLLDVSRSKGAFFLDYDASCDSAAKSLPSDVPELISLADQYFDQPLETKMKDFRAGQAKGCDRGFVVESECEETFEIAYDELVQGHILPDILRRESAMIDRFMRLVQSSCRTMLSCLSEALQLNPEERFELCHKPEQPSESGLKLIYEPTFEYVSDWFDNTHTDSGSFTVLFYDKIGLDIYDKSNESWAYSPVPQEGCAFVNLANSLERLSHGKLHSPLHRVSQPCDGFQKRYYLSYFLRPEQAIKEQWEQAKQGLNTAQS